MTTVTNAPGTVADLAGVGTISWSNPSNAATTGASFATAASSGSWYSHYLKSTNFGFAIPAATINSVGYSFNRKATTAGSKYATDQEVKGVQVGTITGTNLGVSGTGNKYPTTSTAASYTSAGVTWSVSDLNDVTSGWALAVDGSAFTGSEAVSVNTVTMTVDYTASGGGSGSKAYQIAPAGLGASGDSLIWELCP